MTEKYLDFSFEKTNSAYMLFYERRSKEKTPKKSVSSNAMEVSKPEEAQASTSAQSDENKDCNNEKTANQIDCDAEVKEKKIVRKKVSLLSKDLEEWIWQDNRHYLEDRNIFEHTYFK